MLYLVLVLVVASLGLLVATLTTANTLFAWISLLISVIAGGLMVLDWIQNRRRRSREAPAAGRRPAPPARELPVEEPPFAPAPPPPPAQAAAAPVSAGPAPDNEFDESFEAFENQLKATPIEQIGRSEPTYETPVFGEPPFGTNPPEPVTAIQEAVTDAPPEPVIPESITAVQQPVLDPAIEPPEENTDATDLLVVSELPDEVVVIDERPRYHLNSCAWLGNRPILPLPVSEARDLGFTPCALCSPDANLAAQQRARS